MNGPNFASSIRGDIPDLASSNSFNLSILSNRNSDFLTRNNTYTTSGYPNWIRGPRFPTDVWATPRITSYDTGNKDPWGIADSPIIDDDEPVASEREAEEVSEVVPQIEEFEGIAEGAEVASSSTPWGFAAIVNQQLGQATSKAITTQLQNQSSNDYSANMLSHGLNVGLNASIIQQQQENVIRNQELGGTIGSFFGPIGALIGHAVAGFASVNPQLLDTAGSFQGWINPQQSGIVASQTTSGDLGENTQVDNVDTTNDS